MCFIPSEDPFGCSASRHKQPQMASQEADTAGLGISAVGIQGSQVKPEGRKSSVYQPMDDVSQDYQKGILQALGAIQILNGAMILALGVFMGSLQNLSHLFRHFFIFIFYTGYPFWGAVFFISSGSLSVAAGRKPTRMLMQNSFGMNIASTTIALVGTVFLLIHLGLVSLMLILTLLELGVTVSIETLWCQRNFCASREAIASPPNYVESGIPSDESDSESMNTQLQISKESGLYPSI
ncbi:membrane-spanning 4-domains subfamily A member 3 isoform X3 [Castor canadensis]|uniref:Membrane-spanning 4-domains subfamily A member 3 isoform X3 n=1 Tax=Castor canadensis TaxID=51338 RepID=A0AC58M8C8_CASCN